MTAGDHPPVGILLCTRKNEALVEFALGDLPNKLFVLDDAMVAIERDWQMTNAETRMWN